MSAPINLLALVIFALLVYITDLRQITTGLQQATNELQLVLSCAEAKIKDLETQLAIENPKAVQVNTDIKNDAVILTTSLLLLALLFAAIVIAAHYIINFRRAAVEAEAKIKDQEVIITELQDQLEDAREEINFMEKAVTAMHDSAGASDEGGDNELEEEEEEVEVKTGRFESSLS